jgi:hypothetical protein
LAPTLQSQKGRLHHGTYPSGGKSGTFFGIASERDQFCHREGDSPEHCDFVYTDGAIIY